MSIRSFAARVLNKIFMRSTIARTQSDVRALSKRMRIMDKRLEYMIARVDAFAEAEDAVDEAMHDQARRRDEATVTTLRRLERQAEATEKLLRDLEAKTGAAHASLEAALERQSAVMNGLAPAIERNASLTYDAVQRAVLNESRQREAAQALLAALHFGPEAPELGDAAPDYLLHLHRHVTQARPKVVVELGGGTTTLVIASALAAIGQEARLYSVDDDEARVVAVQAALRARGLGEVATVRQAPLVPWAPPHETRLGREWQWYAMPAEIEALETVDLLVVGGPRREDAVYARYPAVPHFRERMHAGSTAMMNDTKRADERAVATEWSERCDMRAQFFDVELAHGAVELVVRQPRP